MSLAWLLEPLTAVTSAKLVDFMIFSFRIERRKSLSSHGRTATSMWRQIIFPVSEISQAETTSNCNSGTSTTFPAGFQLGREFQGVPPTHRGGWLRS